MCLLQTATSCRTWDAVSNGKVEIAGILNQPAQPMVVLFLNSRRVCHSSMIMQSSIEGTQVRF